VTPVVEEIIHRIDVLIEGFATTIRDKDDGVSAF
jgi:hypothetical protein